MPLKSECFNPRAREGRDDRSGRHRHAGVCFNPRAREGRDYDSWISSISPYRFNPRAREGRDTDATIWQPFALRFNPRAREGRDLRYFIDFRDTGVSIHAPARGATSSVSLLINPGIVSIHAPARGATTAFAGLTGQHVEFQSTRPRGARLHDVTTA